MSGRQGTQDRHAGERIGLDADVVPGALDLVDEQAGAIAARRKADLPVGFRGWGRQRYRSARRPEGEW